MKKLAGMPVMTCKQCVAFPLVAALLLISPAVAGTHRSSSVDVGF
jgi:hypothetical protein